jgi:predicted GH43/DUF377 family glycosyl hydrolase
MQQLMNRWRSYFSKGLLMDHLLLFFRVRFFVQIAIACSISLGLRADLLDLDTLHQDLILETRRIEIPGYPYAFNPSMVRWNDFILMSFRIVPDPKQVFVSQIGVILLDSNFNPIGEPQILETRSKDSSVPARAEDARLVYIRGKLYIVYSDNLDVKLTGGGFRLMVGELEYARGIFSISNLCKLTDFPGQRSDLREKNWVPFDHQGRLRLAYSISPHLIFEPIPYTGICHTLACTSPPIDWDWGILRGGTPALLVNDDEYLAFFHSVKKMATVNSKGKTMSHYFIGAYTFSSRPPFQITRFSLKPIVGANFYSGIAYKPYWGSIQCVYPAGLLIDEEAIWISYGRQDHEIWVAKLDKQKLYQSLINVL